MYLEADCTCISSKQWDEYMKGARKASYKNIVRKVKNELPELYRALALQFLNPYDCQCKQTKTHYILVHSAIEYFIHK